MEQEHADSDPIAEFPILRNVWRFEWMMMDGRTTEWDYEWDIRSRVPSRLELNTVFERTGDEFTYYFATPPLLGLSRR